MLQPGAGATGSGDEAGQSLRLALEGVKDGVQFGHHEYLTDSLGNPAQLQIAAGDILGEGITLEQGRRIRELIKAIRAPGLKSHMLIDHRTVMC